MAALELRLLTEDDLPELVAAVNASLDHLRPWMPWAGEPATEATQGAWLRDMLASPGDQVYGAFEDARLVGCCGLHARIAPGGLEIGYWTRAGWTRRGIATAMARRLAEIAFAQPGIDHVEIHHDPANVASGRIPERLGYARAGDDGAGHRVWRLRGSFTKNSL